MTVILTVANRKGGVGKSTVATMLAHAFSVWGEMRVLVVDLDTQANASLILIGGENWVMARRRNRTISNFITDFFPLSPEPIDPKDYIMPEAGDILDADRVVPQLSLVPGDIDIEEKEHEILHRLARENTDLYYAEMAVTGRIKTLLRKLFGEFDLVILDCPPGISFAARAALSVAHKVLIPFRPDYVSLFAVDRIARMIETAQPPTQLGDIPKESRRYVTVANMYRDNSVHNRLVEEIEIFHPILATRIPQAAAIANAFDWRRERRPLTTKYGAAVGYVERLYEELLPMVKSFELEAANQEPAK